MFKNAIQVFVFFLCVNLSISIDNNTIAYYVNLINTEQARAYTYPLPTDSTTFKAQQRSRSKSTYDYIVVGAGSAGAVIASRLTERQNVSVLLIEAGGEESDFSDIPRMNLFLQGLEYNWNYNSTCQETSCLGMINKQCAIPRGRGLGGTSIINALMYVRGNKKDYDDWRDLGNPGWGYNDLLPIFKYSEDFKAVGDSGYHGTGGYLSVENIRFNHTQVEAFIEANKELGRLEVDYNGAFQLGVAKTQMTNIYGRRDSTGKAFLKPARNRTNLHVEKNSLVTKILITPSSKKAYGVLYSKNGVIYEVRCRKEVIISAGSINSPQLLMLSGIGPKKHLRQLRIPVIQNLPVGDNLQDHATYFALHFTTNYTEPIVPLQENVDNYLNGFGRLTAGGNAHAIAFLQTNSSDTSDQPDIEFIMAPSINVSPFIQKAYHYTNETYNAVWSKVNPRISFTIFVILLHPKSRGTVKLKSRSPYHYPEINPNLLSDKEEHDIETMYKGIQQALQLLDTNAFKSLNASLLYAPLPACVNHSYLSKSYWYCQLRQLTMSIFHPIGTCKMGPTPKLGAVVDSDLKVHGICNLRVADASIIPLHISGHTNAPAIMIAEKLIFVSFLCVTISNSIDNATIKYYENLIISEQRRAHDFLSADAFGTKPGLSIRDGGEYDYIIVGAGSAGSVIANRLTAHKNISVLIIEAGGEESNFTDIPLMSFFLQGLEYNWNYTTTTQNVSCLGYVNQQCVVPRGKGLGGSSIINACLYVRGHRKDYDDWKSQGNPGWGYDDVLPLFKRSEDFKPVGDVGYHGTGGYLSVNVVKSNHTQVEAFIEANKELGRQKVDYNGKQQIGVGRAQTNTINGRRHSVGKAFLQSARNRTNLRVEINSLVTRILIKPTKKQAYGVLYNKNGITYKAKCRKEVIVSAGSVNSPQLLMLSGIGPKSHLKKIGIPVIQDLSVGCNLQDHPAYHDLIFETNYTEPVTTLEENVREYLNGFGRLTISANAHAVAFFQTNSSNISHSPDIELVMIPSDNSNPYIEKAHRYTNENFNAVWSKVNSSKSFNILMILLHPKSRGSVRLKSSSPFEPPLINLNFLSDKEEYDIDTMYQGIQRTLQLLETNAFKRLNASLVYNPVPACKHHRYLSKQYWYCQIRQLTTSVYHPVGTCKMGPDPIKGAVVNSRLQVHGVCNLRVADASVIPLQTSGHTNAPAIMIDGGVYDYIIVGAGSAGSVIANRLSARKNISVLLIEAGGEESNFTDIPLMSFFLQGLEYNWNYTTTTQNFSCLGYVNQQCVVPRGKGLGGSSIINVCLYVRGHKKDYDDWKSQGNSGWGYDDVLPLFKHSEDFKSVGDVGYHGTGGYLSVNVVKSNHTQVEAFIDANKELGRQEIDYNGKLQLGVGRTQTNTINGRRHSVGKALLQLARNRTNLCVESNSLVTKILIKSPKKQAYGVLYNKNGITYKAKCRKEVIVSAGTVNSPQLLMLSGIGPKSHLKKIGIPVIQDLSVGCNLQDHPAYFDLIFETNYTEPVTTLEENIRNYLNGFGGFTVGANAQALAFLQTNSSNSSESPDIEIIMIPSYNSNPYIKKAHRYTNENFDAVWSKVNPSKSFTIVIVLLHPKSRGSIKLKSSSPFEPPLINLNSLSDKEEYDIGTMYQGIQRTLQLLETKAFKSLNASLVYNPVPACKHHQYLSKKYWYCQIRQLTMSLYHPIGTCKMGPDSNKGAVVNSKLQVHGVCNLRVADASIIPLQTSGHINAPAIMIGEKLSQFILNEQ
ncbi:hypothetical protein RN001_004166 [Aquatica leii]|uniref:Glucose-methanol-choline oxidoreductase N-terminal domain-containing protein n=1 Tax=Aquatica leii TaxID=1421715 RepID=A0AAN7ST59_9COLE|nr:hypothetical protein RN001_004166 [Aquatica leii]